MEFNSVCNHTRDQQNTRSSDLVNHEYDYRPNWMKRSSVTNNHNFNNICDILGSFF